MFNPRYAQLLQQKGLASTSLNSNLIPTANPIARTLAGNQTPAQNNRETGGFGGRFKDSPPRCSRIIISSLFSTVPIILAEFPLSEGLIDSAYIDITEKREIAIANNKIVPIIFDNALFLFFNCNIT